MDRVEKGPRAGLQSEGPRGAAGDAGEFVNRYNEYFPRVFAYLCSRVEDRQVAQDLVAEVFEKAFTKVADLRAAEAFGAWLFTIARNVLTSYWRKEKPAARALGP